MSNPIILEIRCILDACVSVPTMADGISWTTASSTSFASNHIEDIVKPFSGNSSCICSRYTKISLHGHFYYGIIMHTMYVCMSVCMYTLTNGGPYVYCMYVCMYVYVFMCVSTYVVLYVYIHMYYVNILCMYFRMYIFMYACMWIQTYYTREDYTVGYALART